MYKKGKYALATVLCGTLALLVIEPVVLAVVVAEPKMKPPPAAVPVFVTAPVTDPVAPIVPVHCAPEGQHATSLAASAEQTALTLQQTLAAPSLEHELYPMGQLFCCRRKRSRRGSSLLMG